MALRFASRKYFVRFERAVFKQFDKELPRLIPLRLLIFGGGHPEHLLCAEFVGFSVPRKTAVVFDRKFDGLRFFAEVVFY